ncbi:hypothetical protein F4818DRAFT_186926 [Hypoxylon cercidicola]|nr:hypothetical protein F4818DRAFT_186926 [Hypoxylon cercidicola]
MVSEDAPVPRTLESLPARPPTPPREKKQESDQSSNRILSNHPIDTRLNLHTPPSYSPNSADTTNASSRRSRKRVGFLAQAEYREAPTYANKENVRLQSTPTSVHSSTTSARPIKSILKQSSSPVPRNPLDSLAGDEATGHVNITTMLDSTIKQLAGADRDSKIDAYMVLARALKTSNNLPDRIALQDKMSLLTQFIQRDVTAKGPNGTMDTSMVNHALTLLCTFCHFPAIASTLSSDFGVFMIDHCIRSFEDPVVPKDVIRHLMQVVASQDFPPKVMSADRVGRLIGSLNKIENHIKGKSIIMSRILIYRRLIRQSKSHMVAYSDWLGDLFTDMLSSIKEIRAAAIALGLEASFTIGKEKQLSRKVMELFQMQIDETKYIKYYADRLMVMTKDKDDSTAVPQVWSVVILLLRCPVDKWEFFLPFLNIIQRCFNSGNYHTKLEANYAWNRLVYALHLNETSFSKTIGTICQPFHSQLKRKGSSKQQDELRRVVVSSICNLYYYAFKPNLSPAQVDTYWDLCVRPVIQRLSSPEVDSRQEKSAIVVSENLTQATLILTGLFNSSTPRLWKEDRVAENPIVRPDELPALDPKWVRRNAGRVFTVVEPILQRTFLDLANPDSVSYKLWQTLVGTVSTAASKEVKVSTDTATFMAHAFGVLVRIWSRGLDEADIQADSQQTFLDAIQAYISTIVESLGLLPFTEKLLSLNKQNSFFPVATPSHRSGKGQGLTRTPLHHLFSILSSLPPGISDDDGLLDLIKAVFDPFIISRSSSHAKIDLAREFMNTLPNSDVLSPYGPWVFLSEVLSLSLDSSQSSHMTTSSGSEPTIIGHEYREIVKHLERGIRSTPNLPWEHWHSFFQLLVTRVTYDAGEAGNAIAVVEPMAKSFADCISSANGEAVSPNLLKGGIELVATARQPRDRAALDAARRRLWGTSIAGSRSTSSFDPFDNFYRLTNELLRYSYMHADEYSTDKIMVPLLTEVASFLVRCNRLLVFKTLAQLQNGVGFWIQDKDARYSSKQSSKVSKAVKVLWDRICSLFSDADSLLDFPLDTIEELLCSAFQSKHRHIVSAVSAMWNSSFEQAEEIKYPENLKAVLISIHTYVDVVLPGLDLSSRGSSRQEPSFIESQEDSEVPNGPVDDRADRRTPSAGRLSSARRSVSPGSVQLSLSTKGRAATTPTPSLPRSSRRDTTPRPRHDDSQIQFAAIESSSPGQDAMESQHLTDRQMEVRERQRENATLFPHIRATVEKDKSPRPTSRYSEQQEHVPQERAATPPTRALDDYVSSTPTPRRGQAPVIYDDHEMTDDISSSPPEPRRNLLAEMRPRSRSSSMFHEFPMSSSPISGSPAPRRQTINHIPTEPEETEDIGDDDPEAMQEDEPEDIREPEPEHASTNVEDPLEENVPEKAVTPRKTRSPRKARKGPESSPRSDPDVFVDALTSPSPQTPRALRSRNTLKAPQAEPSVAPSSQPKDRSFELSDGEERSMARLVIELDSRKCEPVPRYDDSSPEKPRATDATAQECITVYTGSKNTRSRSKRENRPPPAPSSPVEVSEEAEDPPPSNKKSKKKRKRHAEKNQEPGSGRKKRRHRKDADVEAASNNQASQNTTEEAAEMDAAMEDADLDTGMSGLSQDAAGQEPAATEASPRDSSPVSFDDSVVERESDTEAVNLQIITEASQQSDGGAIAPELLEDKLLDEDVPLVDADIEMMDELEKSEDKAEEEAEITVEQSEPEPEPVPLPEPEPLPESEVAKSAAETIMDALKGGLEGLRTATLTREEVNRIEDMFFDIKKELYQAESRSRR